ncbi:MAG TPA: 50S ribosomal protein L29 [Candidatus Paceibacterota bacterium]|nr:50S ribosomal protein L29 [Candidatus Paceibacterota bacterium]
MKKVDFKNKTTEELNKLLTEKRNALKDFNFKSSGGAAKNVKTGSVTKKEIARILTALNSKK